MESIRELTLEPAGIFALTARYRVLIGEEHPAVEKKICRSLLRGPHARAAASQWVNNALPAMQGNDVRSAVQWLLASGFRSWLAADIDRVRRARARGDADARIGWAVPEILAVIETHEAELAGDGIGAFDASLALELLCSGYACDFIDHGTFWSEIDRVIRWIIERWPSRDAYVRSASLGHAVYGSRLVPGLHPGHVFPQETVRHLEAISWPILPPNLPQPISDISEPFPDEDGLRMRTAGMTLRSSLRPGPVWWDEVDAHLKHRNLEFAANASLVTFGGLGLTHFSTMPLAVSIIWISIAIVACIRRRQLLALWTSIRAWSDVRRHGRVRMLSGSCPARSSRNPSRDAIHAAGYDIPDDATCHTLLMAPTLNVAIALDGTLLDPPVPVLLTPSATRKDYRPQIEFARSLTEPAGNEPGRRTLTPIERRQLSQFASSATRELRQARAQVAASFAVAILLLWYTFTPPESLAVMTLAGLGGFFLLVFALRNAVLLVPHTTIVQQLASDADGGEVIIVDSAAYIHQHPGGPMGPPVCEFLPHTHRLWTHAGAEAGWRW